jgi:hypothetical protein
MSTHLTRTVTTLVTAAVAFGGAGVAAAAWTSTGSGAGGAGAVTITAPGAPTAPAPTTTSVSLSWTAASGGVASYRYHVERAAFGGSTWTDVCGSTDAAPIDALSCTDATVTGSSDYQYRVTAELGNWRKASATSAKISVPAGLTVTSLSPTSAASGSTSRSITIAGSGFQSGASVTFYGGRSGHLDTTWIAITSTTVNSASSVTVVVNVSNSTNAVGSYDVTVTNPGGASVTKASAFSVS